MITIIPFIVFAESCKKEIKINLSAHIIKTYNIAYLVEVSESLPAYFTNDELNDSNIDFSNANCNGKPTYIGDVSEKNKYSACIGSILYYDTETYTKDQVVPLKLIDLRDISSFDSNYDIVCTDEDNYRLCQDTATIDYNTKNVWQYSKTVIDSKEGYSYNENDLEYMNFTNGTYSNFWTESRYFTVKTPNNFIMPNHNLFFKSY